MKKIFIFFIITTFSSIAFSQQIPLNAQYHFDLYQINPAAAGSQDYMPVSLSFRKFWVGINGTPSVQALSGHVTVADRMGVGVRIFNYMQGPLRQTGMEATYAYHIPLSEEGAKISLGLSPTFYQYYLDKSSLTMEDPNDAVLLGGNKKIVPDANFGVLLYDNKYFLGISVFQLFQGKINLGTEGITEQQKNVRHYYFNGGYNFEINDNIMLQPSVLLKFLEAGVFQADINLHSVLFKTVNFGLSYRTQDALSIQVGYQNKSILFGYAYDIAMSDLRTQTSGSHEIIFIYKLPNFIIKK